MSILKSLGRILVLTLKRLYDIFATYLLFWVGYLAAVAVGLHFAFEALWTHLGVVNPELVWTEVARGLPVGVAATKLAVVLGLHALVFVLLRRPIAWMQPAVERMFDSASTFFERISTERWSLRLFGESVFTVTVSALLIPFVIQPTLVRGWDGDAWLERGGNLVDGRAVLDLPDSVVGYYRRFGARAVVDVESGVSSEQLQETFADADADELAVVESVSVSEPYGPWMPEPDEAPVAVREEVKPVRVQTHSHVMDRWDDHIREAVSEDEELFSYVKAFMYVESGGRQYAVSRTGCAGLMQFCAGTAKSQPYREVFGTGQVYACGCRGDACSVPKSVQVALESGDAKRVEQQEDEFPCELTDARFDPDRALTAGGVYVERLHEAFDGNVYLMYIGYNSGPGVARRVLRAMDGDTDASIEQIAAHLPDALQPYYGSGSASRSRSLTRVHLPKIQRALVRYGGPTADEMLGILPAGHASLTVDSAH